MKKTAHSRRRLATWLVPLSLLVAGGCSSSQKTASTGKVPAENPSLFQSFMLGVFNSEKDDAADKTETAEQADAADSQGVVVASDEQSVPPKGQALTAGGTTQAAQARAAATQAAQARAAATQAAQARAAATDAASPPPQYGPANPMFRR
jgi:hypothetical protein